MKRFTDGFICIYIYIYNKEIAVSVGEKVAMLRAQNMSGYYWKGKKMNK